MNNEPVAWINRKGEFMPEKVDSFDIPLYAHPVNPYQSITNTKIEPTVVSYTHPVKELTDEEIRHIQAQCHLKDVGYDGFIMRFARAILRKAQEK